MSSTFDGKQVLSRTTDDKEMCTARSRLPLRSISPPYLSTRFASNTCIRHSLRSELSFEWTPPADVLREEAVKVAKSADVVLAFVGSHEP